MEKKNNLRGKITALNTYHTDAYAIAVKNGFDGTEAEWLESLKGDDGYTPVRGKDYMTEADINAMVDAVKKKSTPARIGYVELLANKWLGDESPYSQSVELDGITENSQVDLTPTPEQLSIFHHKDLAFVTENDEGVLTVYAIGQKPENDYTVQVTMTEVVV